jgi:hypothetical protein
LFFPHILRPLVVTWQREFFTRPLFFGVSP